VPAPHILLVSQAKAPDMPRILGVDEETVRLQKLIEGHGLSVQHLAGKDATVGNTIKKYLHANGSTLPATPHRTPYGH
jgi:hypothetical protein